MGLPGRGAGAARRRDAQRRRPETVRSHLPDALPPFRTVTKGRRSAVKRRLPIMRSDALDSRELSELSELSLSTRGHELTADLYLRERKANLNGFLFDFEDRTHF